VDVTPLVPAGRQIIESYGDGRFRVSGTSFAGSILVFAERTVAWPVADFAALTAASLEPLRAAGIAGLVDVVLLGCGVRMGLVADSLRGPLRAAGIVLEPMDTGAACRTYNVLAAEGRRVAAALIAVP
jgi:uncharacterized protein